MKGVEVKRIRLKGGRKQQNQLRPCTTQSPKVKIPKTYSPAYCWTKETKKTKLKQLRCHEIKKAARAVPKLRGVKEKGWKGWTWTRPPGMKATYNTNMQILN